MKSGMTLLGLILIAHSLRAQNKQPWNIDRLCGRVEHVQRVPERHNPNSFSEKRKPLRDVQLSLYERRENKTCCAGFSPMETTQTRKNGGFDFQAAKPGNYWLITNWNGRESEVAVVYLPHRNSVTKCFEQGIALDDAGIADWWLSITVD
jgi:hypothetical protein